MLYNRPSHLGNSGPRPRMQGLGEGIVIWPDADQVTRPRASELSDTKEPPRHLCFTITSTGTASLETGEPH